MSTDINLREIAQEALNSFPPIGADNGAAWNYAQRMLTKALSERRKSGDPISDDEGQALRATVDAELATLEPTAGAAPEIAEEEPSAPQPNTPDIQEITTIISQCFHTATDGSPEHLKHLSHTALKNVTHYLEGTNAGWFARRDLLKQAKQIIRAHVSDAEPH